MLICTFDEKGAQNIFLVADSDSESLQRLINLVESGDLDTQVNSLALINSLLASAGSDLPQQLTRMNDTLGLEKILRVSFTIFINYTHMWLLGIRRQRKRIVSPAASFI